MPQFMAHRNPNPNTRDAFPLILDIQNDLLAGLGTRVVVPLCPASAMTGEPIKTLTPVLEVEGQPYLMLTPQLAGISNKQIGAKVQDLSPHRDTIMAALDLLFTGI